MTFPLAEKLTGSHHISGNVPHQGQSGGWVSSFGRPTDEAPGQCLQRFLTDWPNCHGSDGSLHKITRNMLHSLTSTHQNKWRHQTYPRVALCSINPPLNFSAQFTDACLPSSGMMDGVISILGFAQNLTPKHMAWQMFQQWALFDLPCRCPFTLEPSRRNC